MFRAVLLAAVSLLLLACAAAAAAAAADGERRSYIVHMDVGKMPAPFVEHEGWYLSVLSSLPSSTTAAAAGGEGAAPVHLYTYTHVMHGFSAVLTSRQLEELRAVDGHVAAFPETYGRLHTTHTPTFLGLTSGGGGVWPASKYGDGVIIGIVDTGVWQKQTG